MAAFSMLQTASGTTSHIFFNASHGVDSAASVRSGLISSLSPRTRSYALISTPGATPSLQVTGANRRIRSLQVSANLNNNDSQKANSPETADSNATDPITVAAKEMGAPPKVRVNTAGSNTSVFKGGRAQEVINSRAAMVGFVAAVIAEVATGNTVIAQLEKGGLFTLAFAATIISVFIGSFAPRVNDQKANGLDTPAVDSGVFTQFAEIVNGRSAMLGFVALILTEAVKGSALF